MSKEIAIFYLWEKKNNWLCYSYGLFTVILIPNLVRCIKDFKAEEAIPFDDDFGARKVVFEKKTKKK